MQKQLVVIFKGKKMKKKLILMLVIFSQMTWANCPMSFKEVNLCADLTWVQGPVLNQTSHFQVKFWDKLDESQTALSPAYDVEIYTWMIMANGHNHGGPGITVNEVLPGIFESKDARFFMGRMQGYWQVRVDIFENQKVISKSSTNVQF